MAGPFPGGGTRSGRAGQPVAADPVGAKITEVDRPTRRARRAGKSDPIDALLAVRAALAAGFIRQPRTDGDREAARLLLVERHRLVRHRTAVLNQMRDLVLTAPEELRRRLHDRSPSQLWVSWSHHGRIRSEAAFALLPEPARCRPALGRSPAFG